MEVSQAIALRFDNPEQFSINQSKFNSQLPQAASLWELGPVLVHRAPQQDTEIVLGEREPASASCGHSEASDGGPALDGVGLVGLVLEDVVQQYGGVE